MSPIERIKEQIIEEKEGLNETRLAMWKLKNKEYQKKNPDYGLIDVYADAIPRVAAEQHKLHQLIIFIEQREKMNWKIINTKK